MAAINIFALSKRRWLYPVAGINPNTFRFDLKRGVSCAAFGAAEPVLQRRPLLLDAAALDIRDALHDVGLPLKTAAMIVRGFFDRWAEGVAHVEHRDQDVVFAVVEHGDDVWHCGAGLVDRLDEYIAGLRPLRRVYYIYLRETLARVRQRAEKAGLDLSGGSFFVPPDHPLLAEVKADFEAWRGKHGIDKFLHTDHVRRGKIAELLQ